MQPRLRERLLYFALVPAIVLAVLVLGGVALRTTLQIEKARQQTVFDATLTLANERVDRLDRLIIDQDNVIAAHVDVDRLSTITQRWLPTAARETPTIRAVLVLDVTNPEHDVLSVASRAPGEEDDTFRRLLLARLLPQMKLSEPYGELRHLHASVDEQSLLISYFQRTQGERRVLVVAWHDVPRLVHGLLPKVYGELDRASSRMNVIDEEGRIVYGPPIQGGEFTVGRPFPTTLYNWRLQIALTSADALSEKVERQRRVEILMVVFTALVAILGVVIIIVAATKERRLAQMKSDFVANVSHELKTPLAIVRMSGELLLEERVTTEEKKRRYLETIVQESERLTGLIENVLDFAKIERGNLAYEMSEVHLGGVVRNLLETYRHRTDREGVSVSLEVQENLPIVRLDSQAFELAFVNLLDNAIKYAREGGVIEVSVTSTSRHVSVTVTDNGPGIPSQEQERIFDRFVRGRQAQLQRIRGSGIGLALVKHIAESHGGTIRVTSPSRGNRGAAFVLAFPALTQRIPIEDTVS